MMKLIGEKNYVWSSEVRTGDGMRLSRAIRGVGGARKEQLLDPAIQRLARADAEEGLSTEALNRLILDFNGHVGLLRDAKKRNIITDSFNRTDAEHLCTVLGCDPSNDPWANLRAQKIRKNSKKEKNLFDFFEVPEGDRPQPTVHVPQPDIVMVEPHHGLFRHQRLALEKVDAYLNGPIPKTFLHMPTGSGKTRTAMNYVCRLLNQTEGGLVAWLAFNGELCEQAAQEFERAWQSLGNRPLTMNRFWGSHDLNETPSDGILFIGLDKLWSRVRQDPAWMYSFAETLNLVVFDEAHQAAAETYALMLDIVDLANHAKLLGLSATPGRTYNSPDEDEKLANIFARQKVTLEVEGFDSPLEFLIQEGYLSKPEFRQIESQSTDFSGLQLTLPGTDGEFSGQVIDRLSGDELRNLLILNHVNGLLNEGHTRILVFANSVQHANLLNAYMKLKTEVRCESVTGMTPSEQRSIWLDEFKAGGKEPFVMFNFGVLTTGFDAPLTTAAIISRPTTSLVLYSQMVGRVIRGSRVGGTDDAVVLTVVDQALPGFRDLSEAFTNWEDVWN